MKLAPEIERIISSLAVAASHEVTFFRELALFTRVQATQTLPTAATDGQDIFINEEFVQSLSSPQVDGLLLHEVLHAALLHVVRRGQREAMLWNVAADIVVNGMIFQQKGFELPNGGIQRPPTRASECRGNL
jgi:predicted metal-dependent peptidase